MRDYELSIVDRGDRVETSLIMATDDADAAEIASAFEPTRFWELHRNGRHIADWLGAPGPMKRPVEAKSWSAVEPERVVLLG